MKTNEVHHPFFTDPAAFLKEMLIERKHRNPNYSANAMARDLELSAPFLSQVMNGQRNLSLSQKLKLADRLSLDASDASHEKKFDLIQSTVEHDKIIRYWYHFAILELCQIGKVSSEPAQIADRLGISEVEAKAAIQRLVEFGYLDVTRTKQLKRTQAPFVLNAKHSSSSLRALHRSRLQGAEAELESFTPADVANRNFQTIFVASSRSRIAGAKKLIDEFSQKLMKYLADGDPEEVFQYSTQLFSAEKHPTLNPKGKIK